MQRAPVVPQFMVGGLGITADGDLGTLVLTSLGSKVSLAACHRDAKGSSSHAYESAGRAPLL